MPPRDKTPRWERTRLDPALHGAWTIGPADSDNAILLLHGLGSSPFDLSRQGAALAAEGYRCFAPVIAGHVGAPIDLLRTSWSDRLASAQMALDALAVGRSWVGVAGLSMGGALALHLAATNPQTVSAVVTMSAPLHVVRGWRRVLLPYVARLVRWHHIGDGVDLFLPDRIRELPGYDRIPLRTLAEAEVVLQQLRGVLGQVQQPVNVIHGMGDRTVSPSNAWDIMDLLVNSSTKRLVILPKSGHGMTVDVECDELNTELVQFFRWARDVAPRYTRSVGSRDAVVAVTRRSPHVARPRLPARGIDIAGP